MVLQQIVLELSLDQQPLSSMAERSILKVLSYCPNASMCKKKQATLDSYYSVDIVGKDIFLFFFCFLLCDVTLNVSQKPHQFGSKQAYFPKCWSAPLNANVCPVCLI